MKQRPATKSMKISDVRAQLNNLVNQISRQDTRILVEKDDITIAAIVSIDEFDRFVRLDQEREKRFAIIDEIREAFKDVPQEEIEREAARSVAEARAELRAEREQLATSNQ